MSPREVLRREFMSAPAEGAIPTIEEYLFVGICPGPEFSEGDDSARCDRYVEPEDVLDMNALPDNPILRMCLCLTGWI